MSFHLAAYTELLGTVANTDIDALTDDILFIQNAHFLPQRDMWLVWAWAGSATLNRVRLNSPKFRQVTPTYLDSVNGAAIGGNNQNVHVNGWGKQLIRGLEELQVEATSDIAMGTERFTLLAAISEQYRAPPVGDVFNLRYTSTTAAVANSWTTLTVTYEQQLPVGTYSVIGGDLRSTNCIGWRLIFDDQYWRPGGPGIVAATNRLPYALVEASKCDWGRFRTTNMPRVQTLANAADATHEGRLRIIRVA